MNSRIISQQLELFHATSVKSAKFRPKLISHLHLAAKAESKSLFSFQSRDQFAKLSLLSCFIHVKQRHFKIDPLKNASAFKQTLLSCGTYPFKTVYSRRPPAIQVFRLYFFHASVFRGFYFCLLMKESILSFKPLPVEAAHETSFLVTERYR
jgi:hypothetical protein